MRGGIDLASTFIKIPQGAAIDLVNFEPELGGGYRRIDGYERYDGRTAPSDAKYYTVEVANGSGIAVGATLTGDTSGATSQVVIKDGNTLGVTALSGSYTDNETANGTTITETELVNGQSDFDTDSAWLLAAQDYYRDLIAAAPGDGDALYAFAFRAKRYSLRADSGTVKLYEGTASGWSLVPLFDVLFFDEGTMSEALAEGASIAGNASGATGTVKRFVKNDGIYGTTASGYMVVEIGSGTFTDNENINVSGSSIAKANGASAAITLDPGGTFEHVDHNFYGATFQRRIYVCDGVNPAWEFDGTVLTPIYYPAPDTDPIWNKPTYIAAHRAYLFLFYEGGQMAHSAAGDPLIFNGLLGANEFGLGSEPTGVAPRSGNVLAIYTRRITYGLFGTSGSNWELRVISETFGAEHRTVQKIGTVYALDEKGITPLDRVEAYGDFEAATVSRKVKPILDKYRGRVIGSSPETRRNQYRLYFDDGRVLVMGDDEYLGQTVPDFSIIQYPIVPTFVSSSEDNSGNRIILMGDASGLIYEVGVGNNFDGEELEFWYRTPFMQQRSPQARKGYRRLFIDTDTDENVPLKISYDLGYGSAAAPNGLTNSVVAQSGGGFWGIDSWGEFFWDSPAFSSEGIPITGTANNISVLVYGIGKTIHPFTIETMEVHYIPRRLRRE